MHRAGHERFWEKVAMAGPHDCWEWTGALTKGYGRLQFEGQKTRAYRVAYELLVGPIPEGLQLDHLCRNRACVNPAHLQPVTQRENILRGTGPTAVNSRKSHCKHGHPYDDLNTYTRRCPGGRVQRVCRACRRDDQAMRRKARQGQLSVQEAPHV